MGAPLLVVALKAMNVGRTCAVSGGHCKRSRYSRPDVSPVRVFTASAATVATCIQGSAWAMVRVAGCQMNALQLRCSWSRGVLVHRVGRAALTSSFAHPLYCAARSAHHIVTMRPHPPQGRCKTRMSSATGVLLTCTVL